MKTLRTLIVCSVAVVILCTTVACHRSYYRRQADADAIRLIEEKSLDPHWSLPGYTIEVDPSSRMFDPFSLDHPPMPPDDPSAAEFMREVDGKPGFPHWHANGDTPFIDNPEWKYLLPVDKDGKLVIGIDRAVELALVHSPDYQRELENLYLSALAVSLERFSFETQFFLPFNSSLSNQGRIAGAGNRSNSSLGIDSGSGNSASRLNKLGASGSELIVGLANSIVWQYSGVDSTVGVGALSASLTQPLLRAAGRKVILESLTDAERKLLYNVRQLERFRRSYMQQIVAGIRSNASLNVGNSRIGDIDPVAQNAGGFLGLLQTQQDIRIQESNIASQRSLLEQFVEFYNFQRIELLQLKQFKRSVFSSQSNLLADQASYQTNLDNFKISLGLPPDIDLQVKDPLLNQFVLIDEKITDRRTQIGQLRKIASDDFLEITKLLTEPLAKMKETRENLAVLSPGWPWIWTPPFLSWRYLDIEFDENLRNRIKSARDILQKIEPIYDEIIEVDFLQTEQDIAKLDKSLKRRRNSLLELQKKYFDENRSISEMPVIEPEVLEPADLENLVQERNIEFNGGERLNDQDEVETVRGVKTNVIEAKNRLRNLLRTWDLILANDGKLPPSELDKEPLKSLLASDGDSGLIEAVKTRAGTIRQFVSEPGPEVLTEINNLLIDVSLIQALARVDSLTLPIVDIDWEEALEFARVNRRDWMNARAQLVDAWRGIEIFANDLESTLDLEISGSIADPTELNNPFKYRDSNGQVRIGLQFDAPITRLAERNDYRTALITYQRTKRQFYQYEDRISAQLREIIRLLEVSKLNFEISRIQVKNSVDEVQLASYNLVKPPEPGPGGLSRVDDQTANNLIRALENLLGNQNALIRDWVRYEVLRRQLDLNMGTMQLDERGIWIDPIEITPELIQERLSGEFIPQMNEVPGGLPEKPDQESQPATPANDENEPLKDLPPVSRRLDRFRPASSTSNRPVSYFDSGTLQSATSPVKTFKADLTTGVESRYSTEPTISKPRQPASANAMGTSSLYSNFDSDLKRSQLPNLQTDNQPRQKDNQPRQTSDEDSETPSDRFPVDKKIIDRKVETQDFRRFRRQSEMNKPFRIAPFPFQVREKK